MRPATALGPPPAAGQSPPLRAPAAAQSRPLARQEEGSLRGHERRLELQACTCERPAMGVGVGDVLGSGSRFSPEVLEAIICSSIAIMVLLIEDVELFLEPESGAEEVFDSSPNSFKKMPEVPWQLSAGHPPDAPQGARAAGTPWHSAPASGRGVTSR